jgi:hypothetical protein
LHACCIDDNNYDLDGWLPGNRLALCCCWAKCRERKCWCCCWRVTWVSWVFCPPPSRIMWDAGTGGRSCWIPPNCTPGNQSQLKIQRTHSIPHTGVMGRRSKVVFWLGASVQVSAEKLNGRLSGNLSKIKFKSGGIMSEKYELTWDRSSGVPGLMFCVPFILAAAAMICDKLPWDPMGKDKTVPCWLKPPTN